MKRTRTVVLGIAGTALLLTVGFAASPANAHGHANKHGFGSDQPRVVNGALDNPRQLATDGKKLYVAESGSGGTECQGTGEDEACFGLTSGISSLAWKHHKVVTRTVVGGLPSVAGADGTFAGGVSGVGVNWRGKVYGVGAQPPELDNPTGGLAGWLFVVKHGQAKPFANIGKYESDRDPDGQGVESNPYSVLAWGDRILVADAAGNDVLSVNRWGKISTFHVFPNITTGDCAGRENDAGTTGCDFVPTSLAAGPKGTVFVTGLASEAEGEGRVVQLSKHGRVLHEWSGFTTPVGIAVSGKAFYVSELLVNFDPTDPNLDPSTVGQVTKVSWNKRVSRVVPFPAGLAVLGGKLYVSAFSIAPATGAFGNPAWAGQIWQLNL